jgi:hypothetical protein
MLAISCALDTLFIKVNGWAREGPCGHLGAAVERACNGKRSCQVSLRQLLRRADTGQNKSSQEQREEEICQDLKRQLRLQFACKGI